LEQTLVSTWAGTVSPNISTKGLAHLFLPDDIVAIHYSGHGSHVTDIHNDAPSGKDNTIVPHDSERRTCPTRLRDPRLALTDRADHAEGNGYPFEVLLNSGRISNSSS
jgi:hypothetical protein